LVWKFQKRKTKKVVMKSCHQMADIIFQILPSDRQIVFTFRSFDLYCLTKILSVSTIGKFSTFPLSEDRKNHSRVTIQETSRVHGQPEVCCMYFQLLTESL
jgi:hypothetical protein